MFFFRLSHISNHRIPVSCTRCHLSCLRFHSSLCRMCPTCCWGKCVKRNLSVSFTSTHKNTSWTSPGWPRFMSTQGWREEFAADRSTAPLSPCCRTYSWYPASQHVLLTFGQSKCGYCMILAVIRQNFLFITLISHFHSPHTARESSLIPPMRPGILQEQTSALTRWRSLAPGILQCGVCPQRTTTNWWLFQQGHRRTAQSETFSARACQRPKWTSSASNRSRTCSTGTSTKGLAAVCINNYTLQKTWSCFKSLTCVVVTQAQSPHAEAEHQVQGAAGETSLPRDNWKGLKKHLPQQLWPSRGRSQRSIQRFWLILRHHRLLLQQLLS